jgi:hypothetical protein
MKRISVLTSVIFFSSTAFAEWHVRQGPQVFAFDPRGIGVVATVSAKSPSNGIGAHLQLECFVHPELMSLYGGIVLSRSTPTGPMSYRIQFDDAPSMTQGPFSRVNLTSQSFSDEERKALLTARQLRITLIPTKPPELSYEFDVSGAATAAKTLACKEYRRP